MSKMRILAYLLFILLMLAGCRIPRDPHPERTPDPQISCYRWNSEGVSPMPCLPAEHELQTGKVPAPSVTP